MGVRRLCLVLAVLFPIGVLQDVRGQTTTNVFNHAHFSQPSQRTVFNSAGRVSSAGRIDDTNTSSRQIQFGLKFIL